MMIIQVLVYQYCIVKPVLSVVRAFMEYIGLSDSFSVGLGTSSFWIMFFRVISLMVAMMALLVFYRCCRKTLNRYNVVLKFAVIKVLIALHIAQNLAFKFMVNLDWIQDGDETAQVRSIRIQYLLSVMEMTILAVVLPLAYPAREKVCQPPLLFTHQAPLVLTILNALHRENCRTISISRASSW